MRNHFGKALFWEEYADTRLSDAIGTVFFQRVVVAKILRQQPDESAVKRALADDCPAVFDQLDTELKGRESGIVGGRITIADIALASPFVNYAHAGERIDAARWPVLAGLSRHGVGSA